MKLEDVEKLILEEHKVKFPNVTLQTQRDAVDNEFAEAEAAVNISKSAIESELLDVAIASIGLMRFPQSYIQGKENVFRICFMRIDLEYDTFCSRLLEHWKKVKERPSKEVKDGVYHH